MAHHVPRSRPSVLPVHLHEAFHPITPSVRIDLAFTSTILMVCLLQCRYLALIRVMRDGARDVQLLGMGPQRQVSGFEAEVKRDSPTRTYVSFIVNLISYIDVSLASLTDHTTIPWNAH